jgi:gluconolactonase
MKIDSAGNLWCTGSGGLHIFDPVGDRLGIIETPEFTANFTWGGPDLTELFITATHGVYRMSVPIPGLPAF